MAASTHTNGSSLQSHLKSKKVAIIGAGAAGLVAARELRAEGHRVEVLEQNSDVAGVWRYDPTTEGDPLGLDPHRNRVHSSMYAQLRTNLPREVMAYSDFPFDPAFLGPAYSRDPRRFPSHQEVLRYLEAFADFHDLRRHVALGSRVTGVERLAAAGAAGAGPAGAGGQQGVGGGQEGGGEWLVTWERLASNGQASSSGSGSSGGSGAAGAGDAAGAVEQGRYDAVVVCNGHYSEPRLPEQVAGRAAFPGAQLHAHNYRTPEPYRGQVVLVVGASNSGEDISRELSAAGAARVLLAARSWKNEAWGRDAAPYGPGGNIYRCSMVSELHPDGSATFEDGRREGPIHTVIYCTGYSYSFPFLRGPAAELLVNRDNHVRPLWLHMMPPALAPQLAFIGLPWKVVPFPQFELQAKLLARLLSGRAPLPPLEAMLADIEAHERAMEQQGLPRRHAHMQNMEQFGYNDLLVALSNGAHPSQQRPGAACSPAPSAAPPAEPVAAAAGAAAAPPPPAAAPAAAAAGAVATDVAPLPPWREQLYRAISSLKRARPDDYRDADMAEHGGPGAAAALAAAREDWARQAQALLGAGAGAGAGQRGSSVSEVCGAGLARVGVQGAGGVRAGAAQVGATR